jgi:hypothetical protein
MDINKIFKIGLLVMGFGYLAYLFCPITDQVGRYSSHVNDGVITITDTTNAIIYSKRKYTEGWETRNPITGRNGFISGSQ